MKKYFNLLIISILLMPIMVFADQGIDWTSFIIWELFMSLAASIAVLRPMVENSEESNKKQMFWTLFFVRLFILAILYFFWPNILFFEIYAVAFGALIMKNASKKVSSVSSTVESAPITKDVIEIHCAKCGGILHVTDKFCQNCGEPFDGNNGTVTVVKAEQKEFIKASSFDPIFANTENVVVEEFIKKELAKANIDIKTKLIPEDVLKRKNILNIIFGVLVYVYISLIFFHFPFVTYFIGLTILIVFFALTRNFDLMDYLKKELKSRPSEKISNIVMSTKTSLVNDTTRRFKLIITVVAIIGSLVTFIKPVILYEKMEGGYGVRYYAFGLTNYTTVSIPDTHKGEPVISIRGNGFSNMPFLKEAVLPDSITEIRGQAFLNDSSLRTVKLPKNLVTLGGGAFKNCMYLDDVELPETLTELGGESFMNAKSLRSIVLPSNLKEIRGDTFSGCIALTSVNIPDSVTRVGGHAFEGCTSLKEVTTTPGSQLAEIGSSAFRDCDNLYTITIPATTSVNSRAFKNSPTIVKYYGEDGSIVEEPLYENDSTNKVLTFERYITIDSFTKYDGIIKFVRLDSYDEDNLSFSLVYDNQESFTLSITSREYVTEDGVTFRYVSSEFDDDGNLDELLISVKER